jgi:hypothetical protein
MENSCIPEKAYEFSATIDAIFGYYGMFAIIDAIFSDLQKEMAFRIIHISMLHARIVMQGREILAHLMIHSYWPKLKIF